MAHLILYYYVSTTDSLYPAIVGLIRVGLSARANFDNSQAQHLQGP